MSARKRLPACLAILIVLAIIAGCGELPSPTPAPVPPTVTTAPAAPPTATAVPTTAPTATNAPTATKPPAPTATPVPTSPPTATAAPVAALAAELKALVKPALPTPGAGSRSEMDVNVIQLKTNTGDLWLAHSTGIRPFQPLKNHFLVIYRRSAAGWQELSKLELELPDYLDARTVKQVNVEAERIWIQADGGVGAHGGTFTLISFDGKTLKTEIEHTAASPGASRVEDLNGDKMGDVILDQTEYYVFCYACGVRYWRFSVLTWDKTKLVPVNLAPLPDSASADLRRLNNQAVSLAQAAMWKDAQAAMNQAVALRTSDPVVAWNAGLIRLHAELFARQAQEGPYPLLDHLFYGDYKAALDVMRPHPVEQLFSAKSPLIVETPAQGWEKSVTSWITTTTGMALKLQPDLAAAYFLRGWAINLSKSGSPEALADVEKAAQLAPNETLFTQAAAYLRKTR